MSDHSDDMEYLSLQAEERRQPIVRRGRRDRIYPSGNVAGMDEFMEYAIYDMTLDDFLEIRRGEIDMYFDAIERNVMDNIWVTNDNRRVMICDMETSHLKNTIRLLGKKGNFPFRNIYIEKMEAELQKRVVNPRGKFAFLRGWPE